VQRGDIALFTSSAVNKTDIDVAFLLDRKLMFYLPVGLKSYYWQNS